MNKELEKIISAQSGFSITAKDSCQKIMDSIAKPLGGLGKFEDTFAKIAGGLNKTDISFEKTALIVMCADNGIVKEGVSQSDSSVTANIVKSISGGMSSVAVMAKHNNIDTIAIDIGVETKLNIKSNTFGDMNIRRGTGDFLIERAMSEDEAEKAILTGAHVVKELSEKGYELIATGEAGIGNTTTSAALCSVLLNMEPKLVTGKGAGLSDKGLERKIKVIEEAIKFHGLLDKKINGPEDVIDVLSKIGGLDIAGLAGVFLAAPIYKIPVVVDGVIAAVSALVAYMINPAVKDYLIASHNSSEPSMKAICDILSLEPVIDASMHLGEGTGAVLMISLLKNIAAVYNDAAKFTDIAVEQYIPL